MSQARWDAERGRARPREKARAWAPAEVGMCTCVVGNARVLKIRTGTYLKLVEKTRPRSKKRISRSLRPHIALGCQPDHSTRVLQEGEL